MKYCTFIFPVSCSVAYVTSYLSENEAKNLQNGDVHIAQILDFEISREPLGALRSVMARLFAFFTLFHLSLTFFRPEVPFKISQRGRQREHHNSFFCFPSKKLTAKIYHKQLTGQFIR